jgi:hypothetical protein
MNLLRLVTLHNFNKDEIIKVIRNGKIQFIPAEGELQIMLAPDESWPQIEREKC